MKKNLGFIILLFLTAFAVSAQELVVTGTVTSSSDGLPIPGVNIIQKGSASVGTITDIDGNYSLKTQQNATLVFSFVGMDSYETVVTSSVLNVSMLQSFADLDEIIVVGYGVQKKSVVTAAIAKVSSDDLVASAPVRVDNALKGLASGVTVTSASGQPGSAAQIRIRGIGTINNSDPLYIVDGMPIEGGLDYLNPNDISSIEVLKDAASGAVYGARAANGVVLVTTKTGQKGGTKVTYDFSYGWQSPWRERDVLNASEYAVMMNEGAINSGQEPKYANPYSYGVGTNWQKETFNYNAPVVSHQVSVSGADDKINYMFSFGHFSQDGIVGGNYDRSNYERMTLRSNTVYTIFDESQNRNWLQGLKITSNLSYAKIDSKGIETNSEYGSPLGSALALSPMLPVYLEGQEAKDLLEHYSTNPSFTPLYDERNGNKLFNVAGPSYNEMVNPLASLSLPGNNNWSHKFVANFSAELDIWDNLKFKTSYGADMAFWGHDGYTQKFYLTANNMAERTRAYSEKQDGLVWQLENVLMYDKQVNEHSFGVILGQSAKKTTGSMLGGGRYEIINTDRPYIDASSGLQENGDMNVYGAPFDEATLASTFGRASYNFAEKYMVQATIRRDGSSRFGSNNHYAIFPSFSAGWNITNENFMNNRPHWLTSTKLRFSWGKNGNENIGNFRYVVLTSPNNNYIFGSDEGVVNGVKASVLPNPDLKWEESVQTGVGLDFGFLSNSLMFSADYYKKVTDGMLMEMNIPSYVGEAKPTGNVGKMENSGIELEGTYRYTYNDWSFRIGANMTYLKNELIEYGNEEGWANLDSYQGAGTITRAQNGMPFPYFYGYKTDGIFQNVSEINNYLNDKGELIQPNAKPGDVRFVDWNGDGKIDDADRTNIGKGMPDFTYGANLNAKWRNVDLNVIVQGAYGNEVFDATRRTDITSTNLPSWMLNRWTGEGTSDKYPKFILGDNVNWQSSDLYVYDGSYLRIKNLQLGYTLPSDLTQRIFVSSFRVYGAVENLLTLTKYHGFDPEISSGGTSLGIDRGVYPQAKTYSIGLNITF